MTLHRFFILAATFMLLACSSGSDNNGATPFIEGTSDSGGGNGVENKAYEAYIVKPQNLPAYKNIVEPKIKNLLALAPSEISLDQRLYLFQRWVLYKTWYIAPVSLGTISKEVIGVSFSEDQTEQLAIQTKRSIWMNRARFNKMSEQDQATLIIHEMVMSLYYLKYKTWDEISKEQLLTKEPMSPQMLEFMQELYPSTPPRPFDSEDYENIRAVTAGFLGDVKFKSVQEVDDLLIAKKFDLRFTFTMGITPENGFQARIKFGSSRILSIDFMKIINASELIGRTPNNCRGFKYNNEFECQFTTRLTEVILRNGPRSLQNLLQFISSDPKIPLQFAGMTQFNDEFHGGTIEFSDLKRRISSYVLLTYPFPTSFVVGSTFRSMKAVFIEDLNQASPQPVLLGFISVPGVVIGIDKKNQNECAYVKPVATSIQTDVILASSEHLTDLEKSLLRSAAINMPPVTTCIPY